MRDCLLPLLFVVCTIPTSAAEPGTPSTFDVEQLRPFWLSNTMHGESVLFVKDTDDTQPSVSLVLRPAKVLSIGSSSGELMYAEGRDYLWKPGTNQITLPPGSRIVCKTPNDLRRPAGSQRHRLTHRDGNGEILYLI